MDDRRVLGVQERECLSGFGQVGQDARQGQAGSARLPEQLCQVGAVDPVHHDDVLIPVEEVLAHEWQRLVRRQPEQDPCFSEEVIAPPVRTGRSDF
jgi:hypothetical protein